MTAKVCFLFSALLTLSFSLSAQAQMGLEGFQSGRYEVRKTSVAVPPAAETSKKAVTKRKPTAEAPATPTAVNTSTSVESPEAETSLENKQDSEPGLSEQMGSLFSKDAEKIYDFYKTKSHSDDLRQNKVELDFSPLIVNVDSKSNYAARDFHTSYQGLEVGARVWLTPLIGVTGHMAFSLAGNLGESAQQDRTPTYFEDLNLAASFRNFFDSSLMAQSVVMSLHYMERKTQPSTDSETRPRLKSQGIGLGISSRLPSSLQHAWTFGGVFYPRIQHSESASASGASSGSHEESVGIDLHVGGEWKFSRKSQILWGVEAQFEKSLFSGPAGAPDALTGATPDNVSVDQSVYLLKLGYRWGH